MKTLAHLVVEPERSGLLVQALFDPVVPLPADPDLALLHAFLSFRANSVTSIVQAAVDLVHAAGLVVGLDGFAPMQRLEPVRRIYATEVVHVLDPASRDL